jgi:hypothetical protein
MKFNAVLVVLQRPNSSDLVSKRHIWICPEKMPDGGLAPQLILRHPQTIPDFNVFAPGIHVWARSA